MMRSALTRFAAIAMGVIACASSPPRRDANARVESRPDCFIEWNPGCPGVHDDATSFANRICQDPCSQTRCWSLRLTGDAGPPVDDCRDAADR